MRLGLNLGYWTTNPGAKVLLAQEADRLGYHSVWVAEAWGSDCVTSMAWIAARTERIRVGSAIMQMPARTPANAAMTAASLDLLSGGRVLLGLGASGPQVVEGWHGVLYGRPLARTREYVEILRRIFAREAPLEYHGEYYDVPLRGGTGLGKPLRLMLHPLRSSVPIYLAAIGPGNVALTAEIADGWLPVFFSPDRMTLYRQWLEEGFARSGERRDRSFDIAPTVIVQPGGDLAACLIKAKQTLAFYIGGMGARGRNFYYDLACRYGYAGQADRIQEHFLSGRRPEAVASVPDSLADEVALCGPRERIRERLERWRQAGVTTLICSTTDVETLRLMADLLL
ncbi:MAG: LLM class F420-dependent oxidoreductase [Acidobacteria bacterium]|nr:LLM class F420-dependent oxidoreductase [Acidobacteriota bacterium]